MRMEFKYRVRRCIFYLFIAAAGIVAAGNFVGQAMDRDYNNNINLISEFNEVKQ